MFRDFRETGPRKSRELFGPEKPFVKLRPAYSVKLVFPYVVKGIKIKITASRRHRFEDTKRIMSPEIRPKSFGTFEKRVPGLHFLSLLDFCKYCIFFPHSIYSVRSHPLLWDKLWKHIHWNLLTALSVYHRLAENIAQFIRLKLVKVNCFKVKFLFFIFCSAVYPCKTSKGQLF